MPKILKSLDFTDKICTHKLQKGTILFRKAFNISAYALVN